MKKYFLVIVIILSGAMEKVVAQTDPVTDSIKQLNLDYYASLPTDSLFHAIPQSYNSVRLFGNLGQNNYRVRGLSIRYPNGLTIFVRPKHYIYMNPIDPNSVWNINLFKKETASYIKVLLPYENGLIGHYP